MGVFYAATLYAIKLSGAAMAVVLLYTAPVWVAMFSRFLFHEPITTRQCGIIALAPCRYGHGLLLRRQPAGADIVDRHRLRPAHQRVLRLPLPLLPLVAGPLYPGHPLCLHAAGRQRAVIFCLTPVSLDHSLSTWGWLLILGGFTGYFAFFCYAQALKRLGLFRTASALLPGAHPQHHLGLAVLE